MLEVRNHATTDIELDGVLIPYGSCKQFEFIKDKSRMRGLMNSGKIAVVYISSKQPNKVEDVITTANTNKDIVQTPKELPKQREVVEDVVTNTSTAKKKRSKDNTNNSEVEDSKSTKGDMNNATD